MEEEDEIEAETDGGEAELGEVRLHEDTLSQGDGGGQESVDTEDDVIELDWENAVRLDKEVVGLDAVFEEHLDVEDAVQTEPEHIQDHEVHVQPLRTGPPEV